MTRRQYAHEQIKQQPYFGKGGIYNPLDELTQQAQEMCMGYVGNDEQTTKPEAATDPQGRLDALVSPPSSFSKSTATKCRTRGMGGVRVFADVRLFRLMAER